MIKIDDFRYMRSGKAIRQAQREDSPLLEPFECIGAKNDHALLLLHGFSSSPGVFRELIPHLKHYDGLYAPTLSGHGHSIAEFAKVTAADWQASTLNAYRHLAQRYHKVDVLGLSLGGLLACHLSQSVPINHLYLLAPALALHLNVPFTLKLTQTLHSLGFYTIRNRAGNVRKHDAAELTYRQLPLNAIIEILRFIHGFQFVAPACPTDVFLGQYDAVVDSHKVDACFKQAKQSQVTWLKQSAHILSLDNDLNVIVDAINKNNCSI